MDAETFLSNHNNGFGRLLGITFRSADPRRIVAELSADERHCMRVDVVHGGAILALADCANAYGAVLNLPPGSITTTIESKSNFLRKGAGPLVRGESIPLHIGRTTSVWRCSIFRGQCQIAEVTQTQMFLPDPDLAAGPSGAILSQTAKGSLENDPRPSTTTLARNFSQSIIDERWKQIFDAASLVISEKGFARATIREIATAAGMPVPTMYQYLESKEDLLRHIFEFLMSEISAGVRSAQRADASPEELIEQLIRTMIWVFDQHERSIKILFQETRSLSSEARQRVYSVDARHIASICALLESGIQQSNWKITDTEIVANLIWFLCTVWPLRHWALGKFGQEQVADAIVAFVRHGILGSARVC